MPNTVFLSLVVESVFIVLTNLFLVQPKIIFGQNSQKARPWLKWVGLVLLSITFCWSIVVGIVLSINEMTFRL